MHRLLRLLLLLTALAFPARAEDAPVVFAAASLKSALDSLGTQWAAQGHPAPVVSYGGSAGLARQVAAGAPADLVILANTDWMDRLLDQGAVATPKDLLGNRLVLVGAAPVALTPESLAEALADRPLAMGQIDAVPAGIYGRAALETLGLWDAVAPRVAQTDNVRAALALAERGEAALALTYASDARASDRVQIAAEIPPESHPPIRYPLALTPEASETAVAFAAFLATPDARVIWDDWGFLPPPEAP